MTGDTAECVARQLGRHHLSELVRHHPLGVAMLDRELRYLAYSEYWTKILGLEGEALLGRCHVDVATSITAEWTQVLRDCVRGESQTREQDVYLRASGATDYVKWKVCPWFDEAGEVGGPLIFAELITDDVLAARRNAEREEHTASLFEHSHIGLNLCRMDGLWLESNQAFLDIIGYDAETADGGLTYWELTPRKYDAQEELQLKSLQETGSYGPYEKEFIRKDGTLIPVRLNGFIVERAGEQLIWSLIEDMSDRKQLEAALEKERLATVQASKLATLGEMAAGVAHELNNPLAIIQSFTEVLRVALGKGRPDVVDDALSSIDSAIGRATRIVTGLRRFARETGGDAVEAVEPQRLVDDALDLTRARIENHGVRLEVTVNSTRAIWCNAIDLSQVLVNLLNNAFDAVREAKDGWIELEVSDAGSDEVEIIVRDSGPTIPADVAANLFNPFFTTKEVGAGTGLGLSISKGVVEALGGTLTLREDAPNTTFVIRVPCHVG